MSRINAFDEWATQADPGQRGSGRGERRAGVKRTGRAGTVPHRGCEQATHHATEPPSETTREGLGTRRRPRRQQARQQQHADGMEQREACQMQRLSEPDEGDIVDGSAQQ